MRTAFFETLLEIARHDRRVMLLVGDLGFGVVEPFVRELPAQFVNTGVAEQNMTGMAAGLALSGRIVFTYSIANFPVLRCLEQIRNDVCYHNVNVKIVAVGGGLSYGSLGPSHHATEDLAVMRCLPNMVVVAPNDPVEARLATHAVAGHPGPCYLRLGRSGEPTLHEATVPFTLGRAIRVREGGDFALLVSGGLLANALVAAERLAARGVTGRVVSVHTVKPLDAAEVIAASTETDAVFTLEEHSTTGGLGSAVAELLVERGHAPRVFRRLGLREGFVSTVGDQEYLRALAGLDADGIAASIEAALPPRSGVLRA